MPRLELAPSILSCDFSTVSDAVRQMMEAGADRIHFDVMDGQFVPPITFGSQLVANLRGLGKTPFEVHLMTQTPERQFEAFVQAGAQTILFHAEATHHAHRLAQQLQQRGIRAGIAINPASPAVDVLEIVGEVDQVLIMTVNPGWGGQEFISSCLGKIETIRRAAPEVDIEVDGGIEPDTLRQCRTAGANVFVSGSYLMAGSSIADRMRELREAME